MGREEGAQEQHLLSQITESTSDVLWMFSKGWDELIFVNSAYEDVWGRSTTTLEDDPTDFLNGTHPDDRPAVKTAMEQLSGGEAVELEYRVNAQEDYERWVSVQGNPVYDANGDVVRVVGIARDITEQKANQQELARYKTLLESIPDGVYLFDTDDELAYVNQAAVEASAFSREELLGQSRSDLVAETLTDETSVEEVVHSIDPLISGDQDEIRHLLWFETKNGPKPFHIRDTRGVTEDGECIGLVSVLRDITDRYEIEEELQRKNERLDEFASLVSHDLRNPLNVASGRLELARQECESEHLDAAAQAHDRMEELIDDLLTLARSGESVSDVEPVDLGEAVTGCWSNVETAEATLQFDIDGVIRADPSRLQQLFENLFRNAVEHGGEDVTITVDRLEKESGFFVADDGPGIPAEKRSDVFDTGYSTGEGTGVGLSIVDQIAEAHDWTATITNGRSGGARFEFTNVDFVEQ